MKRQIKIGNLTYTVRPMLPEEVEHSNARGYIMLNEKQEIVIDPALQEDQFMQTLWHEIIHAVLTAHGYIDEDDNDKLIRVLANGLYQVTRDNELESFFEQPNAS